MIFLLACTNDNDQAADLEVEAILAVKDFTAAELGNLASAAVAIQSAAPADAWTDPTPMEAPWADARSAYERVEGAIAVLFPDLDASTDERYDGFLAEGPDDDLFDGEHVTGVHAIERIVWAGRHPAHVVAFESALPDYTEAAFPASADEATRFRDELCQRLVDDTATMEADFAPLALDSAAAFRGVIGSMAEQYEKVNLASTGEDESRYAQFTLADMRANLEGGESVFEAFEPWVLSLDGGETLHDEVHEGFERVAAGYDAIGGDAIPEVPATWNPDAPSEADLATDYGQLWLLLSEEADPTISGSLVERMNATADLLGIAQIPG